MKSSTDCIERSIVLKATPSRVWRALTNAEEFGSWFGIALKGKEFVPGSRTQGNSTYPGYEHLIVEVTIERMEPERVFSWRWHPYDINPSIDCSKEPTTLVVFELQAVTEGTLLKVTESGFDQLPASRRELAFRMNCGGWDQQIAAIEKHVASR